MSADNCIGILKTTYNDESQYFVSHLQAPDNFYDILENSPKDMLSYLIGVFGCGDVYSTHKDALEYANKLADEYEDLEYGILDFDASNLTVSKL